MGKDTGIAIRTPEDAEIDRIRQAGSALIRQKKVQQELVKQIESTVWGSGNQVTRGNQLSMVAREQLAEFITVTGANITQHIDMLGGKPFLNSNFWTDRLNTDPYFVRYEQRDLSPSVDEALRARAKRHGELAKALDEAGEKSLAAQRRAKAMDLDEQADEIVMARKQWNARLTATAVVETTIYRFMNAAPIEAIQRGEIEDLDRYIVTVTECNWAGGMGDTMKDAYKRDPIGDANPGTTARTRSLRRAAVKGFSAWMQKHEEQIRKAEDMLEAEFEIIQEDRRQIEVRAAGPQAVGTSNGEPDAGDAERAQPLPSDDDGPDHEIVETLPYNAPKPEQPEPEDFDRKDAHKKLFATLNDAGIKGAARKTWAAQYNLPTSTKDWSAADYGRAIALLVWPVKEEVLALVNERGLNLSDLALEKLKKDAPQYLSDWNTLRDAIRAEGQEPQEGMDL